MEGLLLVVTTLALLSLSGGRPQEYCDEKKHCPIYSDIKEIRRRDLVIEKRSYEASEWLKTRITDMSMFGLKAANARLRGYCEGVKVRDDTADCERWPIEVSIEGDNKYLCWPFTHRIPCDDSDDVQVVKMPRKSVYAMRYTGMPSEANGQRKHEEMVEALNQEGALFDKKCFTGATYNPGIFNCANEILIDAYD